MLVEFASPVEAMRSAIEVQRGMVTRIINIPPKKCTVTPGDGSFTQLTDIVGDIHND